MFEEDFERCFICQTPCKGLYCSSECRLQDKGTPAGKIRTSAPMRLTAKLPDSLSPMIRPTHHISPSPKMPAAHTDTSSSSSISSSPLQSPRTNPSGADSPQREVFDLPPPAFPTSSLAFSGSIPVKIPPLLAKPRPSTASPAFPAHTPASHSTVYPPGASIETLRFGRKPSVTNSVTSPNALIPRCACGKPANHSGRSSSKERKANDFDSGFSRLSLGPTVLQPAPSTEKRHVSDGHLEQDRNAYSGHSTPQVQLSGSYLSRSRSDPAPLTPNSYRNRQSAIAPRTTREVSVISPTSRRSTSSEAKHTEYQTTPMSRTGSAKTPALAPGPSASANDAGRGRSRERIVHPREETSVGLLNHPPEREVAPSRSRHRNDNRRSRGNTLEDTNTQSVDLAAGAPAPRASAYNAPPMDPPQIMPSWSKRPVNGIQTLGGEGVAPTSRRGNGSGAISPKSPGSTSPRTATPNYDEDADRRRSPRIYV